MGVCYYPEHWPKTMWAEDLSRMKAAGIQTVRIGEFAWTLLEPQEGKYNIGYFDDFLALCLREGISVILGTPTATPPAWLTEKYPEVLNADKKGVLLRHGCRRHYNYNSWVYQQKCAAIVEEMARHYGPHLAVVGWQIDNELNCEVNEFYSEADHTAFRKFLQKKYGTLEALNDAWGTVVWSQIYTDWDQVYAPRPVLNDGDNPHLMLDYYRFISESCLAFASRQAEILRKYIKPGDFVTTNGLFGNLDNHRLEREILDVYTYDSYPSFAFGLDRDPRHSEDLNDRKWTRNLIETRSVCPHFGIMEQQSGACGWASRMEGPAPRPGQLTLWAMQSVAQGADFVSFFRWRTATVGTEIYWHGILDYDNRDNRKLREVTEFGRLLKTLDPVCGAENVTVFALLKDYDNQWDAQADAWHRRVQEPSEKEIFIASELNHTPYDSLFLRDDTTLEELVRYPVLIYPHPMLMNEKRAALLAAYVEQGGTLILGCRSGLKDLNGRFVMMPQPGLLQSLTGTDIRDFTFVSPAEEESLADWNGAGLATPVFNDILTPLEGTKVLATYARSYYAGEAALTEKISGKGRVLHLGSTFTRENVKQLMEYTGIREPFAEYITAPEEVQVVMRRKEGKRYLFVLNYQAGPRTFTLHAPATLMYNGESVTGEVTLPAYGTAVYELMPEAGS